MKIDKGNNLENTPPDLIFIHTFNAIKLLIYQQTGFKSIFTCKYRLNILVSQLISLVSTNFSRFSQSDKSDKSDRSDLSDPSDSSSASRKEREERKELFN